MSNFVRYTTLVAGIAQLFSGNQLIRLEHLIDLEGTGTGVSLVGGDINIVAVHLSANTAYDVSAGTLRLVAAQIAGIRTVSGSGVVLLSEAS